MVSCNSYLRTITTLTMCVYFYPKVQIMHIIPVFGCFVCFVILPNIASFNISERDVEKIVERQTHLLENSCKFLWTDPFDSTLKKYLRYPKKVSCTSKNTHLFDIIEETGEFVYKSNKTVNCTVEELTGSLRPNAASFYVSRKDQFAPENDQYFWINADNFLLSCFDNSVLVYEQPFTGFKHADIERLVIKG
ncbi:unnamed protein product [Caenorhabditis bovis]|uniref:Uncharacterized protein n=1 Tax=Caenorhabditis bovis TaxID=2654633 RepID=A0A8S1EBL6_9PELO|nr:unnamed protein product [Caenorhabditis bovis]